MYEKKIRSKAIKRGKKKEMRKRKIERRKETIETKKWIMRCMKKEDKERTSKKRKKGRNRE